MARLYPSAKKKIDESEYDRLNEGSDNPNPPRPGLLQGHEMFGSLAGPKAQQEDIPQNMMGNMKSGAASSDILKGMAGPQGFMPGESGGLPETKPTQQTAEPGTKKPGLFGKLFGYTDPQQTDQLGLSAPQMKHEGIISKIGRYAVPAAFGLFGGAGILPGIMTSMGQESREAQANRLAQEKYEQEQAKLLTPPPGVKEFEYLSKLPKDQQQLFLQNKAAGQYLGLPMQQQKLDIEQGKNAAEIEAKNRALDIQEGKVPLTTRIADYLLGKPKMPKATQAPMAPQVPNHDAAIQWAKANPSDPRAAKILQINGVK